MTQDDVVLQRLADQIQWYDAKSQANQTWFKRLKLFGVACALVVPILAMTSVPRWIIAAVGAMIALSELVQQLNQYQQNWITYRSTCEALKHEQYLYLASAGPYRDSDGARALLAERVEGLVSQEHAKWVSAQEQAVKAQQAEPAGH